MPAKTKRLASRSEKIALDSGVKLRLHTSAVDGKPNSTRITVDIEHAQEGAIGSLAYFVEITGSKPFVFETITRITLAEITEAVRHWVKSQMEG